MSPSGSMRSRTFFSVRLRNRDTCTGETPRRRAISTWVRFSTKRMRMTSCSRGEKLLMVSSMTMRSSRLSSSLSSVA